MKSAKRISLPACYEFGEFRLDTRDKLLFRGGDEVHLAPKAIDILIILLRHHSHVVEKDDLLSEVWPDTIVEENNLTRTISTLRRTIDDETEDGLIETIPKRGYRFVGEVRELEEAPSEIDPGSKSPAPDSEREAGGIVETPPTADAVRSLPAEVTPPATGISRSPLRFKTILMALTLTMVGFLIAVAYLKFPAWSKSDAFPGLKLSRFSVIDQPIEATVSPDGRYVAYSTADESGSEGISIRKIDSEKSHPLATPVGGHLRGLIYSPDGEQIYYTHTGTDASCTLYRTHTFDESRPVKLMALGTTGPASVSSDGLSVAFVRKEEKSGLSALLIADLRNGTERRILERKRPEFISTESRPAWSGDGGSIAVITGSDEHESGLKAAIAKLSKPGQITEYDLPWLSIRQFEWLGDNNRLVFLADPHPDGWTNQFWVMSLRNGSLTRITNDLADYSAFGLTSDRSELVTVQNSFLSDIWIVPIEGSGLSRKITSFNDRREGSHGIDWTPDGRIVFSRMEGGNVDLWIMNADGSQRTKLTYDVQKDANYMFPDVSPDGRYVVFVSEHDSATRIWRMEIDGTDHQSLTEGPHDTNPHITYDGRWVVYTSTKSGRRGLWKAPLAGGDPVLIAETGVYVPVTSPKNSLIACGWPEADGRRRIAVIDVDGLSATRFYDSPFPSAPSQIEWMADGQAISYNQTTDGISNIWKLPVRGGTPSRITDLSFEKIDSFAWSRDGKRLAIVRALEISHLVIISGLK